LTLDDDVASKLKAEARNSGEPFKQVVNRVLRIGLNSQKTMRTLPPFRVKTREMGLRPGFDLDNIEELLDKVEGPFRR